MSGSVITHQGRTGIGDGASLSARAEGFWAVADAAINPGEVVMLTGASNAKALKVTASSASSDHRTQGVYQGEGGTGIYDTTFVGQRRAVAGDVIRIIYKGVASVLVDGTTAVAQYDCLGAHAGTAGQLQRVATSGITFAEGSSPQFIALEARGAGVGLINVMVNI